MDELNHAWWTAFWSHQYDSFDQIETEIFTNLGPAMA